MRHPLKPTPSLYQLSVEQLDDASVLHLHKIDIIKNIKARVNMQYFPYPLTLFKRLLLLTAVFLIILFLFGIDAFFFYLPFALTELTPGEWWLVLLNLLLTVLLIDVSKVGWQVARLPATYFDDLYDNWLNHGEFKSGHVRAVFKDQTSGQTIVTYVLDEGGAEFRYITSVQLRTPQIEGYPLTVLYFDKTLNFPL